jgi:hypothetical protein
MSRRGTCATIGEHRPRRASGSHYAPGDRPCTLPGRLRAEGVGRVPQDPAEIQQQIEATRIELAETVDAIAEIVSPKRVAKRSVEQAKAKVEELRERANGTSPRELVAGRNAEGNLALPAAMRDQLTRTTEYGSSRTVRWDRVGMIVGTVLLLALIRRRRSDD